MVHTGCAMHDKLTRYIKSLENRTGEEAEANATCCNHSFAFASPTARLDFST